MAVARDQVIAGGTGGPCHRVETGPVLVGLGPRVAVPVPAGPELAGWERRVVLHHQHPRRDRAQHRAEDPEVGAVDVEHGHGGLGADARAPQELADVLGGDDRAPHVDVEAVCDLRASAIFSSSPSNHAPVHPSSASRAGAVLLPVAAADLDEAPVALTDAGQQRGDETVFPVLRPARGLRRVQVRHRVLTALAPALRRHQRGHTEPPLHPRSGVDPPGDAQPDLVRQAPGDRRRGRERRSRPPDRHGDRPYGVGTLGRSTDPAVPAPRVSERRIAAGPSPRRPRAGARRCRARAAGRLAAWSITLTTVTLGGEVQPADNRTAPGFRVPPRHRGPARGRGRPGRSPPRRGDRRQRRLRRRRRLLRHLRIPDHLAAAREVRSDADGLGPGLLRAAGAADPAGRVPRASSSPWSPRTSRSARWSGRSTAIDGRWAAVFATNFRFIAHRHRLLRPGRCRRHRCSTTGRWRSRSSSTWSGRRCSSRSSLLGRRLGRPTGTLAARVDRGDRRRPWRGRSTVTGDRSDGRVLLAASRGRGSWRSVRCSRRLPDWVERTPASARRASRPGSGSAGSSWPRSRSDATTPFPGWAALLPVGGAVPAHRRRHRARRPAEPVACSRCDRCAGSGGSPSRSTCGTGRC